MFQYAYSIISFVEVLDGKSWSSAPSMIVPRASFGLASFNSRRVFAVGGEGVNTAEAFNGSAWTLAPFTRCASGPCLLTCTYIRECVFDCDRLVIKCSFT